MVLEQSPFRRKPINVGCLKMGIAHTTERIPTLIVRQDKYDIRPLGGTDRTDPNQRVNRRKKELAETCHDVCNRE